MRKIQSCIILLNIMVSASSAQLADERYRYCIADFNNDGFIDTLVHKTYREYGWEVYAINGKSHEAYCLLEKTVRFCGSFLDYIPIPEGFSQSEQFVDSLYAYVAKSRVRVDSMTPEVRHLTGVNLTDRSQPDQVLEWIQEVPRPPGNTVTRVQKDSAFFNFIGCGCGTDSLPVFDHSEGLLIYSGYMHRRGGHRSRTWYLNDLRNDTVILSSVHGVIIATDSSYAWLIHSGSKQVPLGYQGMFATGGIQMVSRIGRHVVAHIRLGSAGPEILYVVDTKTGVLRGKSICSLLNCVNIDRCNVHIEAEEEMLRIYNVEYEYDKFKEIRLPFYDLLEKLEQ